MSKRNFVTTEKCSINHNSFLAFRHILYEKRVKTSLPITPTASSTCVCSPARVAPSERLLHHMTFLSFTSLNELLRKKKESRRCWWCHLKQRPIAVRSSKHCLPPLGRIMGTGGQIVMWGCERRTRLFSVRKTPTCHAAVVARDCEWWPMADSNLCLLVWTTSTSFSLTTMMLPWRTWSLTSLLRMSRKLPPMTALMTPMAMVDRQGMLNSNLQGHKSICTSSNAFLLIVHIWRKSRCSEAISGSRQLRYNQARLYILFILNCIRFTAI